MDVLRPNLHYWEQFAQMPSGGKTAITPNTLLWSTRKVLTIFPFYLYTKINNNYCPRGIPQGGYFQESSNHQEETGPMSLQSWQAGSQRQLKEVKYLPVPFSSLSLSPRLQGMSTVWGKGNMGGAGAREKEPALHWSPLYVLPEQTPSVVWGGSISLHAPTSEQGSELSFFMEYPKGDQESDDKIYKVWDLDILI